MAEEHIQQSTAMTPSIYDTHAPKLQSLGYFTTCIGPGTKAPQHVDRQTGQHVNTPKWESRSTPNTTPQPGCGIGLRCGDGIVAIDADRDDLILPVMEAFPHALFKRGRIGITALLRSHVDVPSKDFKIDGRNALQVLSSGRQTVLPPTLHPDTGAPYTWESKFTLYEVQRDELPLLPENYLELLKEMLGPLGYVEEPEVEHNDRSEYEGDESPYKRLNTFCLDNLPMWVPQLGLYKLRRLSGRYPAYAAVADWRPSSKGRSLKERAQNLKIKRAGIYDWGPNKSYSPIDLVMAAKRMTLEEAVEWLDQIVEYSKSDVEVDFENLRSSEGPSIDPAEPHERGCKLRPTPPIGTGAAWHFGTPAPALPPMLVPGLLPRKGYGYIGGQWGTLKTFITNDLAVAVATGGRFAGQQVTMRGAVVQIELEGSHSELRLHAAANARGVGQGELPIVHLRAAPQTIMNNGKPNPEWPKWSKDLVRYAKEIAEFYELPLALITLDPQNRLAGFKDEQSSSEGQIVSNALNTLWRQADCLVLVVDHFGKDAAAGLRGTSVKETNPLFVLGTGETKKDVHARRELEVRKMRNGPSGLAVPFWAEQREVTIKQEVMQDNGVVAITDLTEKTLTIRWGDEMLPVEARRDDVRDPIKGQQRAALVLLSQKAAAD